MSLPESYSYQHPRDVHRLLRSLAKVVCPPGVEELGVLDTIVEHANLTMGAQVPAIRAAFIAGMRTYDLGALARFGRPAHKLNSDKAERYFLLWWHSSFPLFKAFAKAVKGMLCLGYYEMPAVHAAMGYTPQAWIDKMKHRRFALYSEDIERHEQALRTPDPLPHGHFNRPAREVKHAG